MAAGAWTVFKTAKKKLGNGGLTLNSGTFSLALFTSAASASLSAGLDVTTLNSIGNQLASGNNYSSSGYTLDSVVWTFSGNNVKWDSADEVRTASGGAWNSIKFGVIHKAGVPICYSTLSTASFDVGDGSTLTVTMNASGIFVLS